MKENIIALGLSVAVASGCHDSRAYNEEQGDSQKSSQILPNRDEDQLCSLEDVLRKQFGEDFNAIVPRIELAGCSLDDRVDASHLMGLQDCLAEYRLTNLGLPDDGDFDTHIQFSLDARTRRTEYEDGSSLPSSCKEIRELFTSSGELGEPGSSILEGVLSEGEIAALELGGLAYLASCQFREILENKLEQGECLISPFVAVNPPPSGRKMIARRVALIGGWYFVTEISEGDDALYDQLRFELASLLK